MRMSTGNSSFKAWTRRLGIVALLGIPTLLIISVGFAIYMAIVASQRTLTSLEVVLFQLVVLGVGLSGSFWLGRVSAAESARDVIRPHARSALRTILSLRDSLVRLSGRIEDFKAQTPDSRLDVIQSIIDEQIPMGRSAAEDWRDIVPDEVDDVIEGWIKDKEV